MVLTSLTSRSFGIPKGFRLKAQGCRATIPKGLRHPAQGCEERATLGLRQPVPATLKGLRQWFRAGRNNLLLLAFVFALPAFATSPHIDSLAPAGGQRGTELEATFSGD